jgi:hypothetical protein
MADQIRLVITVCAFVVISTILSAVSWVVLRAIRLQGALSQGGHMGHYKPASALLLELLVRVIAERQ